MCKAIMTTALALTVILVAPGCLIVPVHRSSKPAARNSDCPPGHRWSDGKCHSRGKGHDPDKHRGKGKGKDKGRP